MKSIARLGCLLAALLAGPLNAQEQIAWVKDFPAASGMAAEQRRLVLLHFYNDNCEPCLRLEQNVFNRPEVAEAVHQNYIAVKVHAGQNPQLAARYRVNRWPTDVFVTPVGQEVYRTISPQKPADYIAILHQVAQQTGVGASRQWGPQLAQAVVPVAAQGAMEVQRMAGAFDAAAQQATATAQSNMHGAQDRFGGAMNQFQHVANQTQQSAEQAGAAAQQGFHAATQWHQQASSAVQQYQQQATDVREQARQQAGQFGQQVQQSAQAAQQQFAATAAQTTQQFQQSAVAVTQPWQQAAAPLFERRSAFIPQQPGQEPAPTAPAVQPSPSPPALPIIQPPPAGPSLARNGIPLPQQNPWITTPPNDVTKPVSPPGMASSHATAFAAAPSIAPATAAPPSPAQQVQSQSPAPTMTASVPPQQQAMIPASQAPPIALDGFCPVTLIDTVARDPADRSAWKKGDKQFGAIHRGRTYLFASSQHQQKFLASPDAYAPVLSGCDPVRYAERGELIDGKRAYGIITPDRQIYLFAEEATRNRFEQSPASFTPAIQQAMQRSQSGNLYR